MRLREQEHHGNLVAGGLREVGGGRRPVVLLLLSTGAQRHEHQLEDRTLECLSQGLRGFAKENNFKKSEITLEVGGWVDSGHNREK